MTSIRRTPMLPPPATPDRQSLAGRVQKGLEQARDAFQPNRQQPMKGLDPAVLKGRTHCFPSAPLFGEKIAEKLGEKVAETVGQALPGPSLPLDGLEDRIYDFKLRNMSPQELFAEEAKQKEILEDATTGPIQDPKAAELAEKRLEALEAERARRAEGPVLPPLFPLPRPPVFPGVPMDLPGIKLA